MSVSISSQISLQHRLIGLYLLLLSSFIVVGTVTAKNLDLQSSAQSQHHYQHHKQHHQHHHRMQRSELNSGMNCDATIRDYFKSIDITVGHESSSGEKGKLSGN